MSSTSQPPPISIPTSMLRNPAESAYYQKQKDALYQLWVLVQDIPGLVTPYPIADGGTNAITAAGARANLGLYSTTEVDTLIEESKRYSLLVG